MTSGSGSPLLLWNRNLSNATSFLPYVSSTMTNAGGINNIKVYSLLCLSCHDGVGALNVLTAYPRDGGTLIPISGYTRIGDLTYLPGMPDPNIGGRTPTNGQSYINLSDDHPISIDYPISDSSFQTSAYVTTNGIRLYPNGSGQNISIECTSCHDVHNEGDSANVNGTFPFLRVTMKNSTLCLTCHIK
ncbi:MAG: cytochrome c3 family protein [Nitrospiraceae bacterium]|nr:cytochrome c3 family protein [Nitrospiraceae bacterium]